MDDRTTITELSNMTLPVFIRKFNSMPLDERINLLKNPYLDELNEVIFSSLFLQVQNMEEVRELLDNKKIFHKVLTSPKNKKKRNILNIIGEDNFPLLKYIFESNYILDYKEQSLDYIDSIDTYIITIENNKLNIIDSNLNNLIESPVEIVYNSNISISKEDNNIIVNVGEVKYLYDVEKKELIKG